MKKHKTKVFYRAFGTAYGKSDRVVIYPSRLKLILWLMWNMHRYRSIKIDLI